MVCGNEFLLMLRGMCCYKMREEVLLELLENLNEF
ncbi:hypothetical protein SAMN05444280_12639 [Tangfeifania diversioriginum]|uniref:Uncharacterized protein n=1 Tax=Tangfeifania diversioriginum TaxID=1168035 RepID=A0A1M6LBQ1_9BACT|nr:hypothetical protein SAMN05444280_12639 [Tangfeifania diversioriginum]